MSRVGRPYRLSPAPDYAAALAPWIEEVFGRAFAGRDERLYHAGIGLMLGYARLMAGLLDIGDESAPLARALTWRLHIAEDAGMVIGGLARAVYLSDTARREVEDAVLRIVRIVHATVGLPVWRWSGAADSAAGRTAWVYAVLAGSERRTRHALFGRFEHITHLAFAPAERQAAVDTILRPADVREDLAAILTQVQKLDALRDDVRVIRVAQLPFIIRELQELAERTAESQRLAQAIEEGLKTHLPELLRDVEALPAHVAQAALPEDRRGEWMRALDEIVKSKSAAKIVTKIPQRPDGSIACRERLGGLLKYYHRPAA
jgi:hypothetical protein